MEQKSKLYIPPWRRINTGGAGKVAKDGDEKSEGRFKAINVASGSSRTFRGSKEERKSENKLDPSEPKHSISLQIGASFMRFIKGSWGSTQKKIEEEFGVKLIFPLSRNEDVIIIEGTSVDMLTRASKKIHNIVDEVVNSRKLDYSHFVSLPLALHPELVEKLVNFQTSILGSNNLIEGGGAKVLDLGIEKSIFIKPATFHLTVLMLKLWNKDRVAAAAEVLQSVASKVHKALDSRPVSIRLKGLECMIGTWPKARVVYVPVEEIGGEGRLERACQVIIDAFIEAGLLLEKDAQRKLKLHATVMNARYGESKQETKFADSFDARGIFKQYRSEEWGCYLIHEAHLSQRRVFDENGYFHCCSSIPFPQRCPRASAGCAIA